MLPRHYEDLTVGERENVIKKRLIEINRKKYSDPQNVEQTHQEVQPKENHELEVNKKKYIELFDQYNLLVSQILDLFATMPLGGNKGDGVRFQAADRIPRFYEYQNKQKVIHFKLLELGKKIVRYLPVNDSILKKIKRLNEDLVINYDSFVNLFNPTPGNDGWETDLHKATMKFNKIEVNDRVGNLIDELNQVIDFNKGLINYLESTPRSGQGMKFNIDTTEYKIPSKYL